MQFTRDIYDKDYVIQKMEFTFNGFGYKFIGVRSMGFHSKVYMARDILKRDDGQIMEITRHVAKAYFGGKPIQKAELVDDVRIIKPGKKI